MRNTLIASASALALMGSVALAQTATTTTGTQGQTSATASAGANTGNQGAATRDQGVPDISRASRIVGQDIYNQNGEDIGEISELILDPKTGQVQQVIVSVGGFLGIGERNVALPWNELKLMKAAELRGAGTTAGAGRGTVTGTTGGTATTGTNAAGPAASTGAANAPASARAGVGDDNRDMRFVVNRTRYQLKNAPEFSYDRRQ